jgi:hypothetical protein
MAIDYYTRIWQIFFENTTLSLYSIKFYKEVYLKFKGYGIKHFLVCCFLASILNTVAIFNNFTNYLVYSQPTYGTKPLEAIFSELPELKYDGQNLYSDFIDDETFYIKNPDNPKENLLAIDLNNDKAAIENYSPYILTKNELIINSRNPNKPMARVSYNTIYNNPGTLNGPKLKQILTNYMSNFKNHFLYSAFPVVLLLNVYISTLQNIFLITFAGMFVKFGFQKPWQDGARTITFALSGVMLLKALVNLFIPEFYFVDYYSIITICCAARAIMQAEQDD